MIDTPWIKALVEAGLPADSQKFTIAREALIESFSDEYTHTIALTDQDLSDADLVSKYDADNDRERAVDEACEEVERDTRENIGADIMYSLRGLINAVEAGRVEDAVSVTDLLLHGESIAILREAVAIIADHVGIKETWQR